MPFNWSVLEPVRLEVDARELAWLSRQALRQFPQKLGPALRPVLERAGQRIDAEVDQNLGGRVLKVRSGRGRGSWVSGLVSDLAWQGQTRVGYLALWERGFTARAGLFPVPGQRVRGKRGGQITVPDPSKPGLPEGRIVKRGPGDWVVIGVRGKQYPMLWARTRGGRRAPRRWAQPALDAVVPDFRREVNRTVLKFWSWIGGSRS